MARLISVFGATGAQGKAVVNALLGASNFKIRALTRNPKGADAQALLEKPCEVVKVDMDDGDSLERAISGSYGVFAVTNYWGILEEESQKKNPNAADDAMMREIQQGKTIGDLCKKLNVRHLVYSGLENVQKVIGKPCQHFDGKGIVEKYLDKIQVSYTSTRMAGYYENYEQHAVQKQEDGTFSITLPMNGPVHMVSVNDLGPVVVAILKDPDQYFGMKLGISGDEMTINEYAAIISEVTGKTLKYNQVSHDTFANFPFLGAADMAAMYEYFEKKKGVFDTELTRSINPNTVNFRTWVESKKDVLLK